jgi:hypothetical protein
MALFNNDHEDLPPGMQLLFWGIGAHLAALAVIWRHLPPDGALASTAILACSPLLVGFCLWQMRFEDKRDARWFGAPDWLARYDFDTYWLGYFGAAFLLAAILNLSLVFNVWK